MTLNYRFFFFLVLALLAGLAILWIDSRPGWDDTGITAGLLVLTAALFGFLNPEQPWIWAIATGIWIPLHSILQSGDYKMLLVTLFAFAGAYLGSSVRKNKPADPS